MLTRTAGATGAAAMTEATLGAGADTSAKTALYSQHIAAGARMVEFAGLAMPVFYEGIVAEHRRVRGGAGVFDVSHMGEFIVSGHGALPFLERITTNRVADLTDGRVQYSAMCYEDGGFIDDFLVYKLPGRYMLVVNASNRKKDLEWMRSHATGDLVIEDASDEMALVAVQGPRAEAVLSKLSDSDPSLLSYYEAATLGVLGRPVLVSRTGYTGEDGFEIYCAIDEVAALWDGLLEAGAEFGAAPIGLGARDTLRLEMGYCLYGNDIDETRSPVEAGLLWITKLDKGDFIGRDAILRLTERGSAQRLLGFEVTGRGVPRQGQRVLAGGDEVGIVTSGTFSPSLEKGIGMGYFGPGVSTDVEIEIRGRMVAARITPVPFYRGGSVRRKR